MHVVRGLQSEMLQRAENDRISRSRRVPSSPSSRRQPGRVISQIIRRLRPAVHQEVR
ncbi:MAG: hypothetical protein ACHQEA_10620 [Gaiellales bacterium]